MTIIYYLLKMVMFILYYLYSNTSADLERSVPTAHAPAGRGSQGACLVFRVVHQWKPEHLRPENQCGYEEPYHCL